jgi:hypothetical protein
VKQRRFRVGADTLEQLAHERQRRVAAVQQFAHRSKPARRLGLEDAKVRTVQIKDAVIAKRGAKPRRRVCIRCEGQEFCHAL